jgi:sugar (pentulose or hexulose) kinase
MNSQPQIFVGIDIGTSGCRGCAIDIKDQIIAETHVKLAAIEQDPFLWSMPLS